MNRPAATSAPELVLAGGGLWGGRLLQCDRLTSTNQWLLEREADLAHGDVVWALAQSGGRGRLGRAWFSVPGKSLTCSVLLRGPELLTVGPNVGQAAALAIRDVLAASRVTALLKWPNDLITPRGKIAGILVESGRAPATLILGIGLNVNLTPEDVAAAQIDRAVTSLLMETGAERAVPEVLRDLLLRLATWLDRLRTEGLPAVLAAWQPHDALAGHAVSVDTACGVLTGECLGLDELGRLRIRGADGHEDRLWAGDAERVRRCVADLSQVPEKEWTG